MSILTGEKMFYSGEKNVVFKRDTGLPSTFRSCVVGVFVVLSCFACATVKQADVTSAKAEPASLTSNHRYYYRAIVDRTYDVSSFGLAGGTRELKLVVEWWVSVALNQTQRDSVYFQAKIDSSKVYTQKAIPEVDIALPSDLGRGAIVEGAIVLSQRDTSVRMLKSSLAIGNPLFVLVPDPVAAKAATIDTVYSQQQTSRVDQDVHRKSLGFFLLSDLPIEISYTKVGIKETYDDVQGKSQYYFSKNGILIGAKLNRQVKTNTRLSTEMGQIPLKGFGTDSVSITRLP